MTRFFSRTLTGLVVVAGVLMLLAAAASPTVLAVDFFGDACQGAGADSAACSGTGGDNISGTDGIILRTAALLAIIAGVVAVIMIMIAAIMFITAGGDTNKIGTAKKMVTYAVVGLVVILLARTIVVFVVNNV